MRLELGFGTTPQTVELPDENSLGILEPNKVEVTSKEFLVEAARKPLCLGHKAAAIGMALANSDIYLVSGMDPDFVKRIFLKPFQIVQSDVDVAFNRLGKKATVLVMPYSGLTLPIVKV